MTAVAALVAGGSLFAIRNTPPASPAAADSRTWTMPSIESLKSPKRSALQTAGLIVIRCYLFAAMAFLAVRTVQITLGSS